jgi:hypothetical protein
VFKPNGEEFKTLVNLTNWETEGSVLTATFQYGCNERSIRTTLPYYLENIQELTFKNSTSHPSSEGTLDHHPTASSAS